MARRHAEPQGRHLLDWRRRGVLRGDAPRFRLWRSQSCECRPSACGIHRAGHRQRRVGKPTYSLTEALDLTQQTKITVDGLYSGPKASESDQTTTDMKSAIESHGGIFLTQSNGASIDELVRDIQSRRDTDVENKAKSSMVDAPGLWTLALAVILIIWIVCAWRLRR